MALVINGNAYIGSTTTPNALNISGSLGVLRQPHAPVFQAAWNTDGSNQGAGAVAYGNVDINVGSCYNSSNGRFTAPVAGYYYFWANVQSNSTDSTNVSVGNPYISITWWKNGSTYGTGEYVEVTGGGGEHKSPTAACVVQLAVNDYIQVYASRGCRKVQCGFNGFLIT